MASFIDVVVLTDQEQMTQEAFERMAEAFEGWEPAPGNPETFLIEAWSRICADTAELAADVPGEIFYAFGTKILGIPPQEAASATMLTTWTFQDTAGYTIPEGTPISVNVTGDTAIGFSVVADTLVLPGDSTAEGVMVEAIEPGAYANGAGEDGNASLIDGMPYVTSIEIEGPAEGGYDAEEPDEYLNRLVGEITTLTRSPLLPEDVEAMLRSVPGVYRALAVDLYNPNTETYDNEKTLTFYAIDEDGEPVGSEVKAAGLALLQSRREQNFEFYADDPLQMLIDVEFEVTALPGFDLAEVNSSVSAAIANYLNPLTFGYKWVVGNDLREWVQEDYVRRNELIALADNVPGVDHVLEMKLAEQGDALAETDVELTASHPAVLPMAGDITVAA